MITLPVVGMCHVFGEASSPSLGITPNITRNACSIVFDQSGSKLYIRKLVFTWRCGKLGGKQIIYSGLFVSGTNDIPDPKAEALNVDLHKVER
jgi:hypothetical protein